MLDELSRLANEIYHFVITLFSSKDFQILVGTAVIVGLFFWFFDEVDK